MSQTDDELIVGLDRVAQQTIEQYHRDLQQHLEENDFQQLFMASPWSREEEETPEREAAVRRHDLRGQPVTDDLGHMVGVALDAARSGGSVTVWNGTETGRVSDSLNTILRDRDGKQMFRGSSWIDIFKNGGSFSRANFEGVTLVGHKLENKDFRGASFRNAYIARCKFRRCNFAGAEFAGARIDDSQFRRASFERANLVGVQVMETTFFHSTMPDGAVWEDKHTQSFIARTEPETPPETTDHERVIHLENEHEL